MKPMKRGQLEENVEWAKAKFLDSGNEVLLSTKKDSVCHFFEPIEIGNDSITLRLDWSAIDSNGHPTLDADFYNKDTKKKRSLKGERKNSHHTISESSGKRSYIWEFQDFKHPFSVSIGWLASVDIKNGVKCEVEVEVIKGQKNCNES